MLRSLRYALSTRICVKTTSAKRTIVQFNKPGPPPLPAEQQREFEELVRAANSGTTTIETNNQDLLHPDARKPIPPEFEGEVNPQTGEIGGPKREPVRQWTAEGDWSYKGRVSDF